MSRMRLTAVVLALTMFGGAAFAQAPALRIGMRDDPDMLRIASPEMLPGCNLLPHLTCSPPACIGGGGDGADQHGDTRRVGGCVGGTVCYEQPQGARAHPG